MKQITKIVIAAIAILLLLFAWAPWLDDRAIHDKVFQERARIDGTIQPIQNIGGSEESLQALLEESRKKGIYDGVLICDYKVSWWPFGRYVASCEGGYFVNFLGQIIL